MDWKEPTGMSGKCRDINICQKDNFPIPSVSASWDTREHLWQWLSIYILWCKVQVTETQINNALLMESNQFIAAISYKSDNRASERLTNTQLCRFIDRDRKLYWSTLLVYSGRKDLHGDKKKQKTIGTLSASAGRCLNSKPDFSQGNQSLRNHFSFPSSIVASTSFRSVWMTFPSFLGQQQRTVTCIRQKYDTESNQNVRLSVAW
jgi:hypothetical protein